MGASEARRRVARSKGNVTGGALVNRTVAKDRSLARTTRFGSPKYRRVFMGRFNHVRVVSALRVQGDGTSKEGYRHRSQE